MRYNGGRPASLWCSSYLSDTLVPLGTDNTRYQDRLEKVVESIFDIHQASYGFILLVVELFEGVRLKRGGHTCQWSCLGWFR